eukprot:TRINITY_DN4309_c0_g8_i1.p1 TRINITY_DN4309_c0_g8~~TRINITY_DN4309_c0_g8_i1.p1  ORF type:complete len:528 (+),score=190.13 TRINITY_DN4309_c0_g8_i1:71-1654(+)
MSTPGEYKRNVYILSFAFFCVFTAYSAIQNLEASVVRTGCKKCNAVCWAGDPTCTDGHQLSLPKTKDLSCSFTDDASGKKYCAKYGGKCGSTCPNKDGGWTIPISLFNGTANETATPEFDECGSGTNVGSIAIGILYAVFTTCCLIGPYVVEALGAKWSIATAFVTFTFFCTANFLVAMFPDSTALQWGALVPSSALVGFAASFLWTAQGAYVTLNANKYAYALNMDKKAVLGTFYGIFFGFFQTTQISGNLAASLLLDKAGWSNSGLMLFYLCFAGAGTLFAAIMIPNVTDDDEDYDDLDDDTSVHSITDVGRTLGESIAGMTGLWSDRRMALIIPMTMYTGAQQGFMWGSFTANWVKPSLGTEKIGYVMAAFGASDVLGSVLLGRASDIVGRFPIVTFGALCQLFVLVYLHELDVGDCDRQWTALLVSASLWGFGDAVWNTQLSCILGEVFTDRKEDAFSNMKLWQSLATAVIFFLGFDPDLLTQNTTLYIILGNLAVGYGSYLIAHFVVGLTAIADSPKLVNDH